MQKEHSISTHIDLRQTIIRSAETYLHHITASGQTTSPIKLRGTPVRVDEHVYLPLALRGGMEPNDLTINDKAAKIVAYNADKAMLKVRLDGEISADRIMALEVYSDISFLARRILNWAQAQDVEFTAGAVLSSLADQPILIPSASDEQRQAIEGVLSSPLAYVWGVPGAGKTSVVLAECIARRRQNQRCACRMHRPVYVGRWKGFTGRPHQQRTGSGAGSAAPHIGTGGLR